ncbi:hypothetical protein Vadar_032023 [Vaccinium darrowii]|uniref:Uncharacterized protein n=1 Tax=Vaccinium darrowii TaxID=229202 RepID=A0ACB7ZFF3_9ERIC|nr:hypothetical protein Vadar_032023 [Vaccinium darrowii]
MFNLCEAARVLNEENLILQSLQRGPVPPSAPRKGYHTPDTTTLGQKGFAGHAMPPPLVPSGVTTSYKL